MFEPVLLRNVDVPDGHLLATYEAGGGRTVTVAVARTPGVGHAAEVAVATFVVVCAMSEVALSLCVPPGASDGMLPISPSLSSVTLMPPAVDEPVLVTS